MNDLVAGIDGLVQLGVIPSTGCCPVDPCSLTVESIACSFINLLPKGPLWDKAKEEGISCKGWCFPVCPPTNGCSSLVNYAIYTGRRLYDLLISTLQPALREANPYTAWDTMDDWLERLGWIDCYSSSCRDPSLGDLTPYEVIGECGPAFCPPNIPPDLQRIYKRGVINALWKMRHGVARNLAAINFVLEDLYTELVLDPDYDPEDPESKKCLVLRPTDDFGRKVIRLPCPLSDREILEMQTMVQLYLTPGNGVCIGAPEKVYPTQLAAHCIVRSLLPSCDTVCILRKP